LGKDIIARFDVRLVGGELRYILWNKK
jgi:hypothetical protein